MCNEEMKFITRSISDAKQMGKHDKRLVVSPNGQKYLLCGTPLAIEDIIEGQLFNMLNQLAIESKLEPQKIDEAHDSIESLVENTMLTFEHMYGFTVLYGSTEY